MKKSIILLFVLVILIVSKTFAQLSIQVKGNNAVLGNFQNGSTIVVAPYVNTIEFVIMGPTISGFGTYGTAWVYTTNMSDNLIGTDYDVVSESNPIYTRSVSACDEFQIGFYLSTGNTGDKPANIRIKILRLKNPVINGPRLCQGQSGDFTSDFQGSGTNFNWSGSGGVSISANGNAYMNGSSGKVFCTASNQCGSKTESKFMGVPNDEEFGLYNIPYFVNPYESYTLGSYNNSNWTTYYGYFNGDSGNQNTQGTNVVYRTTDSPMNVVYVTQSNGCGSATKTITMWSNNYGFNGFYQSNDNEMLLDVFPNPTSTTLNLRLSETNNLSGKKGFSIPEKIALYDKNGSLVRNIDDSELQEMVFNRKVTVDVKDLIPSEYFLHLTYKRGNVKKIRIIVGDK
jgi:Secretion system C-terminal sorting domain